MELRTDMMGFRNQLYRLAGCLWLIFSQATATVTASPRSLTAENGISVIVGLDTNYPTPIDLQHYGSIETVLYKANAYAMTIPDERTIETLRNHPGVEYVDYDGITMPMATEEVGWGLPYIQAMSDLIPPAAPTIEQVSGCFRMCIVDGGLLASHPDIPYTGPWDPRLQGQEFNLPPGETWHGPLYHHGTHVAGIAIATAGNGIGIRGVIDDDSNICLSIARIFPDSGEGQKDSVVLEAVSWCADQGARIINLSLGSRASGTKAAERLYNGLFNDEGILVVSSSGNGYSDLYNYPASFSTVVSVGAVGPDGKRASFSNYNNQVNLVAPGVGIRSTAPISAISDQAGNLFEMRAMEYSNPIQVPITAGISDSGRGLTDSDFVNSWGKLCVAQRGTISFMDKALLCQKYGGIALVVYNNETGILAGTLAQEGLVSIPVVSVSQIDGALLRQQDQVIMSPLLPGYTTRSGTSMAAPFVSGVAAKLWAARPACSNEQIRQALYKSASTAALSAAPNEGFAESFGVGLVQADSAYLELMKNPPPCGGVVVTEQETNSGGAAWFSLNNGADSSSDGNGASDSSWSSPWRWFGDDGNLKDSSTSSKPPTASFTPIQIGWGTPITTPIAQNPPIQNGWGSGYDQGNGSIGGTEVSEPSRSISSWYKPWTWKTTGGGRRSRRNLRYRTAEIFQQKDSYLEIVSAV